MKLSKDTNALSKLPWGLKRLLKIQYPTRLTWNQCTYTLICFETISKTLPRQIAALWPRTCVLCNWSIELCVEIHYQGILPIYYYLHRRRAASTLRHSSKCQKEQRGQEWASDPELMPYSRNSALLFRRRNKEQCREIPAGPSCVSRTLHQPTRYPYQKVSRQQVRGMHCSITLQ